MWVVWAATPQSSACENDTMRAYLQDARLLVPLANDKFTQGGLYLLEQ
jgi:hypothetical protein